MKYADRDELRKAVADAGGIEQALFKGLLDPQRMPDDEMRFQAKDLHLVKDMARSAYEESPLDVSVLMFEHALGMESCFHRNAGARWIMGESPDE